MGYHTAIVLAAIAFFVMGNQVKRQSDPETCVDEDDQCMNWADDDGCYSGTYTYDACPFACGHCKIPLPAEYDPAQLPRHMKNFGFLLGRWRNEDGGKADFPGAAIPVFTYGEDIDFKIAEVRGQKYVNYTAFAWGHNTKEELHSENGWLTGSYNRAALTTVMNNGFTMVEEGTLYDGAVDLELKSIGRVSFNRDINVTNTRRAFTRKSKFRMEQIFHMATIRSRGIHEHTRSTYLKIYP